MEDLNVEWNILTSMEGLNIKPEVVSHGEALWVNDTTSKHTCLSFS